MLNERNLSEKVPCCIIPFIGQSPKDEPIMRNIAVVAWVGGGGLHKEALGSVMG